MNLSKKDYRKLYQLQDKFLTWWDTLRLPFYLTEGTALGRFYLNHRLSEDLDFFINSDSQYLHYISELKNKITERFTVNLQQSLFSEDFTRLFITEDDLNLKIELVNDIDYYAEKPVSYHYGMIDTPLNILSNKLTAIVSRDEPKDIFDIIHLSVNYAFNWQDIFYHSKQKAVINELDVEQRLISFPVSWFKNVNWLDTPPDLDSIQKN
ncbi:MAG: nucleotidyl transferase AbiEii/AbiGii toxin family protein [Mangrovibacterium sp.]